ncbi:thioredoxin family protein [Salinigranum sp.]|uniref:thioredoxin family protein n=1 Tax=Salinigranum sp. TaxID=1966351 RepID=UPI003565608E
MQTLNRPVPVETSAELDALAAEHPLVLVEFYTNGCAICQSIEPVLGNVARASDVVVATCNPQTDLSLVERFGVQSVPTLVLLEDGEEVGRLADGFQSTEAILEFVEDARSDI